MSENTIEPIAILWDLDGTLIDSATYHFEGWRDMLASQGVAYTYDDFLAHLGIRNDLFLKQYLGPDLPEAELTRLALVKEEAYRSKVRTNGLNLLPGAEAWLRRVRANGWKQALASSAPRPNIDVAFEVIESFGLLDAHVSAEEVAHGKPFPDVFLAAAKKLEVPIHRCIVVEDAPLGIEAARRAGMKVIGVLTTHTELEADLVVNTLEDLDDESFLGLLQEAELSVQTRA